MRKNIIASLILLSLSLSFSAGALGITDFTKIIDKIRPIIDKVKSAIAEKNSGVFPFGGKITHREGGCHIKYHVWFPVYAGVCAWSPGPPIPIDFYGAIGGNKGSTIEVGPPGIPSPSGQMFTFPFITQFYAVKFDDLTKGAWTLGLGWKPFPIKEINEALDKIPCIGVCSYFGCAPGSVDSFHLDCSDSNTNVILKIGSSN